jgi:hypothetical protein
VNNFSRAIWQAKNVLPEPAEPASRVTVFSKIFAFASFVLHLMKL